MKKKNEKQKTQFVFQSWVITYEKTVTHNK